MLSTYEERAEGSKEEKPARAKETDEAVGEKEGVYDEEGWEELGCTKTRKRERNMCVRRGGMGVNEEAEEEEWWCAKGRMRRGGGAVGGGGGGGE